MKISLIAAVADNRVIGGPDGGIPWKLEWDAEHFRSYTQNKWVLLGRKTYSEMEGWFTTQHPVVLTSRDTLNLYDSSHRIAASVEEAIQICREQEADELCVCGGASVYKSALPLVEKMILTRVHCNPQGKAFFPDYKASGDWETIHREFHSHDSQNTHDADLEILVRKSV